MVKVLCRIWNFNTGSVYRTAILNTCGEVCKEDDLFWRLTRKQLNFMKVVFSALPPEEVNKTTVLQVRLELLRWGSDLLRSWHE